MTEKTILENINSPEDIKKLTSSELEKLAGEIREKIVETVAQNGGHLASNLGVYRNGKLNDTEI